MKKICLLLAVIFSTIAYSQDYTYTHYETRDGLAGSTVYCADQDKDGFIWFGTETGLSRFDGTNFLNYTIDQGLPDNEIIKVFCDSRNRVWLSLFRPEICYLFNGKIHNQSNDSILKKIHLKGIAWQVCEDKYGNILIREYTALHIILTSGEVHDINKLDNQYGFFGASAESKEGNFLVTDHNKLYSLTANGEISLIKKFPIPRQFIELVHLSSKIIIWPFTVPTYKAYSLDSGNERIFQEPTSIINAQIIKDSLICFNKIDGCSIENFYTHRKLGKILPAEPISSVFVDDENTYWFTTLGHGVFKLNSVAIKTIPLTRLGGNMVSVFSLQKFKESILAGTDGCYLFSFNSNHPEIYERHKLLYKEEVKSRIINIQKNANTLYIGTDDNLITTNLSGRLRFKNFLSIKALLLLNKDSLLVGGTMKLMLFNLKKFIVKEMLLNKRVTCLNLLDNNIYIGTIDGLTIKNLTKKTEVTLHIPSLKTRITALQKDSNNIMWIGTYGKGLIAYKNGKVVNVLSLKDGLNSSICTCLCVYRNNLWVGTDKGLNLISLKGEPRVVAKYTNSDGLPSNIINTVLQDSETVFVGTSNGITYFNYNHSVPSSKCILHVTTISSGNDTLSRINIKLLPAQNEIKFDYVAISFNSGGEIKYYYKIDELKNIWTETNNTSILFPSLPAGKYTFRLRAVNKYGVSSKTVVIPFLIEKKLWQQFWFQILVFVLIIFTIWYFINLRIKFIRKQEFEKKVITTQMADLKQRALKSQINPHFVFNCLNSIQQYIIDNDIHGSNRFITNFARIIRKTLDFSEKNKISLQEELNYLHDYLKLEQERFENSFKYFICMDENINAEHLKLPPLILQPLIENAIRHGVRARGDDEGLIKIEASQRKDNFIIIIQDNGPGINNNQSKTIKINHTSMGLSLVKERIKALNDMQNKKILFQAEDLNDSDTFKGTIIKIQFPIYL